MLTNTNVMNFKTKCVSRTVLACAEPQTPLDSYKSTSFILWISAYENHMFNDGRDSLDLC